MNALYAAIDRKFDQALAQIRRDKVFTLDPWRTTFAIEDPDAPQARRVSRVGRPRRPAGQRCKVCQIRPAAKKRSRCHRCSRQAWLGKVTEHRYARGEACGDSTGTGYRVEGLEIRDR